MDASSTAASVTILDRRTFCRVAAVAALAFPAGLQAQALAWPERPVRVIVPFPPGGAIDAMARLLAPRLSSDLGQPVVIENRAGAGGTLGTEAAMRATDQHTLLMVSLGHAVNPALYGSLPYDGIADFQPVAPVGIVANVLVVPAASPWRNVASVVAASRAKPGQFTYASAGNGTSIHLAGALFAALAKIELTHVPYRGSGPAVADLIAGRVDMMFDSVTSSAPHVQSGRLRALAVTTATRIAAFPDLSTMAEAGVGSYRVDPWFALVAPKSLPEAGRARMEAAVRAALGEASLRERFAAIGAEPMPGNAGTLWTLVREETARWAEVVKTQGITSD